MERRATAQGAGTYPAHLVATALLVLLSVAGMRPAIAGAGIRIEAVEPAVNDSTLVCTLHTRGLPDPESRETLLSGLPSALIVAFSLLDGLGRELDISRVEIRIEPDLWEQTLILRTPLGDRQAASLAEVSELLARMGPLPVLPLARIQAADELQIHARLAVEPLAASEYRRMTELFTGQEPSAEPNRREVSVGFGSLVRYFLGKKPEEDWVATGASPSFQWRQLATMP
jgi:hypothetical protein